MRPVFQRSFELAQEWDERKLHKINNFPSISMSQTFIDNLSKAQGRSEFVIVVNADIRGFSAFSMKDHDITAQADKSCYSLQNEPAPSVIVDCVKMLKLAEPDVLSKGTQVCIGIAYVPRPLRRT